jgi:hypothetical protein
MAVGSALGCSLMGCEVVVDEPSIPCLSNVQAPVPVPGTTYIWASKIGCALDCDLEFGYNKHTLGAATDDGPRINAAMAGASASNPITLIIDGSALISGLHLPAGGYWSIAGLGCGTGFFIKSGANSSGIHNGAQSSTGDNPGPPAPARGMNVSLSNFTLNGNQGNGHNGDSTTGSYLGNLFLGWYFGIDLVNLNNITIENVVVVNSPAFHIRFMNVGNVVVTGCVMRSAGLGTDGLHFDGPANDISISNCNFTTGDDAIALNCPEGYSGNISRVTVTNCVFNSWSLMRLDTIQSSGNPAKFNIDSVTVSNCSGTLRETGFLIGWGAGSNPNSLASLTVSNCSLTAPSILHIGANFGTIALNNVTLTPPSYQPDVDAGTGYAFARATPYSGGCTYVGSNLTFNNCAISRNANVAVAALILNYGSTINNLEFNGFSMKDSGGSYAETPELLDFISGSIGQLILDTLDSTHIKAPVSAGGYSNIGPVSGAGVLATGWEFPDAVMANGVPYISASTGLPSIKVNGMVEPYP